MSGYIGPNLAAYDEARAAFTDDITMPVARAVQAGISAEDIRADFEAVLSIQDAPYPDPPAEMLAGQERYDIPDHDCAYDAGQDRCAVCESAAYTGPGLPGDREAVHVCDDQCGHGDEG